MVGGALEDLVHWRGETARLVRAVRRDGGTTTVTFTRAHAAAAAARVADGTASPRELVDWAQAVHFEEWVDFEAGHEDLLTQFLFEISTPELCEPVTAELCRRWLGDLRASSAHRASGATRTSPDP
ncbi:MULTISPECIES: hypothetical protein [Streptomyces]|uniref:Uncharacterized protein n=1 Tax=Streptomyces lonegramiae TaxID=3075524 RepID=A0ABU2XK98_9ACTN|nr:hypothetical protein [Streptomyces sp. DSM 41529]MDT0546351.1 hypothetical protein [Streptomyces sp. DSM 41529]